MILFQSPTLIMNNIDHMAIIKSLVAIHSRSRRRGTDESELAAALDDIDDLVGEVLTIVSSDMIAHVRRENDEFIASRTAR